jgi:hypothetical protein
MLGDVGADLIKRTIEDRLQPPVNDSGAELQPSIAGQWSYGSEASGAGQPLVGDLDINRNLFLVEFSKNERETRVSGELFAAEFSRWVQRVEYRRLSRERGGPGLRTLVQCSLDRLFDELGQPRQNVVASVTPESTVGTFAEVADEIDFGHAD